MIPYPISNNTRDGSVIWETVGLDITTRRNAEENLKESKERLSNITEDIAGMVVRYKLNKDGSGELQFISKGVEELYEITVQQALQNNQLLWDRVHKDDLKAKIESLQNAAKDNSP